MAPVTSYTDSHFYISLGFASQAPAEQAGHSAGIHTASLRFQHNMSTEASPMAT